MADQINHAPVLELEREIHHLEQRIRCCPDDREKRVLKRRLKKAQYRLLSLLGKLG